MVFTPSRAAVAVRPKGAVKEVTHQLQCFSMLKKSSNYMSSSAAKTWIKSTTQIHACIYAKVVYP
jgi:hypothetical protein